MIWMRNVAKKYPHHQILSFVEIKTSKFLHDVNDALPKKIVCVNTNVCIMWQIAVQAI